jgi:hypothetical protein
MSRFEQLTLTRTAPVLDLEIGSARAGTAVDREARARRLLRSQISRLERELSALVADGFPDIPAARSTVAPAQQPRLLSLAELERDRDALVGSLRTAQGAAAVRAQRHRAGRELLAAMQLEPARYKFVRLRAVDIGERGCGVWEVRPRLGVIGMLAGWWRVKLSSGCPLGRGRATARPAPAQCSLGTRSRSGGSGLFGQPRTAHARRSDRCEHPHEGSPLTLGHRAEGLLLGHRYLRKEPAAACLPPPPLTHKQVGHGHGPGLRGAIEDHIRNVDLAVRDPSLQLGACQSNLVGTLERTQVLWDGRDDRRCRVHCCTHSPSRPCGAHDRNIGWISDASRRCEISRCPPRLCPRLATPLCRKRLGEPWIVSKRAQRKLRERRGDGQLAADASPARSGFFFKDGNL